MPIYNATDLPEKVGSTTKDPEKLIRRRIP
jgi:hypothetical protein